MATSTPEPRRARGAARHPVQRSLKTTSRAVRARGDRPLLTLSRIITGRLLTMVRPPVTRRKKRVPRRTPMREERPRRAGGSSPARRRPRPGSPRRGER